ncbi:hypothetical protein Trydic_g14927, partial [Trypoxylus dichotomus]
SGEKTLNVSGDSPTSYVLEVDLQHPRGIDDRQSDLDMAPEGRKPPRSKKEKMLATLYNKEHGKCKVCYRDTDSLIYAIETLELHEDMKIKIARIDASDYPENNPYYIRHGGNENRAYGFTVNEQEVISLYDPPHLLKGIRMLEAKVKFQWKKKEQTASWEDVTKLSE